MDGQSSWSLEQGHQIGESLSVLPVSVSGGDAEMLMTFSWIQSLVAIFGNSDKSLDWPIFQVSLAVFLVPKM